MLKKLGISILIYLLAISLSGLSCLMPYVHASMTDQTPPAIRHSQPGNLMQGEEIGITAVIEDESDISWVNLWYRTRGKSAYSKLLMNRIDAKTYRAVIKLTEEFKNGIEYYIDAVDQFGNEATDGTKSMPYLAEVREKPVIPSIAGLASEGSTGSKQETSIFGKPLFWGAVLLLVGGAVGIGGAGSGSKGSSGGNNNTNVNVSW